MNQHSIALPAALPCVLAAPSAYTPTNDAPSAPEIDAEIAYTTLIAGCRFLIGGVAGDPQRDDTPAQAHIRLRVAGNHLKELDRFLDVLNQACQLPRSACAPRVAGVYRPRLRAVERLRAAACQSHAGRFGTRFVKDLAVAAPGLERKILSASEAPAICAATLAEIARFYLTLAEDLVATCGHYAADLDFAGVRPHKDKAIVVCDGN